MTSKSRHSTDTSDRLARMTEEARTRFRRRGGELLDDAQDQGERALRTSRGWIAKNPGAAVGYAFLAGAVVSFMLRRKNSDD